MMPSGHKAFLVSNTNDVELLLMHNKTYAAEYVYDLDRFHRTTNLRNAEEIQGLTGTTGSPTTSPRGSVSTSSRAPSSWVSRSRTPRPRSPPRCKWVSTTVVGVFFVGDCMGTGLAFGVLRKKIGT